MSDEYIDVYNEDLSFNKTVLKSIAHKNGLLHTSVHIWLYTNKGELLLQKRSPNKIAFPNLWDVSVAGHISTGEDKLTSAIREIQEEIGLIYSKKDLNYIGDYAEKHVHNTSFVDNELHYIYIGKLSAPISELTIQKEELTDLKLIDLDIFKSRILDSKKHHIVPHSMDYYLFVLNTIKEQL